MKSYATILDEHRTQRREQLLQSAADVLDERGIRNTTMDHVAQRAGVSKVILYRYFGSKDKLVHAVLDEVVDAILTADQAEAEWWTERVRRTLNVARGHAAAMRLLVRHASHDPEFGIHYEQLTAALVLRVEERTLEILGPDAGITVPGDNAVVAESITNLLLDAYVRWIDLGDPGNDALFLEWITRSVRAMSYYWRGLPPPMN